MQDAFSGSMREEAIVLKGSVSADGITIYNGSTVEQWGGAIVGFVSKGQTHRLSTAMLRKCQPLIVNQLMKKLGELDSLRPQVI